MLIHNGSQKGEGEYGPGRREKDIWRDVCERKRVKGGNMLIHNGSRRGEGEYGAVVEGENEGI